MPETERLRIGVLAPGPRLARWQRDVLEHLVDGDDCEIVASIVEQRPSSGSAEDGRGRRGRLLLWRIYNNRWVAARSAAVRRVDCADLFRDASKIPVEPLRVGKYSQHFPAEVLDQLRELELDVLLRFGFGILRGDVLDVARYGIWSFHHDDERVIRGGPPSFWEVNDALPTTGVLFQRLTDKLDAGVPLARATFRTVGYSYARNRDRAAFGAAVLPAKVARAVRHGLVNPDDVAVVEAPAPIRRDPSNGQMLCFLAGQTRQAVVARTRSIAMGAKWGVGVVRAAEPPRSSADVGMVEWLPERASGYYADPFPAQREGVTALLVEDFDERSATGVISAFRRDRERWTLLPGVIDPGAHASYPFLLEADDGLYCIPETAQLGRVEAWRCVRFPERWERAAVLLHEPVVDPTVVEWQGRYWLFGGRRDRDANTELWLWHAPNLAGPWAPHPQNPVKIDVTSSRPAGTPFVRDGTLYRPAQDCSASYGGAVVINEVVRLDEQWFEERVVGRVEPQTGRYPVGVHTISHGGGLVTIDGKRRVADLHRSRRELFARLRRS